MTKKEALNNLLELYKHTSISDIDTSNFESVADYINKINDDKSILDRLDDYERLFKVTLDLIPVTELAKLCGLSTRHTYRLLESKTRLQLLKKYYLKY